MEKFNEKLKKRILEEIYETCVKKEFLKHEKTEYNISALEKTLLQNTTHKNISTLIIKQAGIKSIKMHSHLRPLFKFQDTFL